MPHEIAMGKNTQQLLIFVGDNGSAGTHAGHCLKHVTHGRIGRNNRHGFAWPHDLVHTHQHAAADHSTGMKDRKSTRLNSSHLVISYAVFCLKKKNYVEHEEETRLDA